MTITKQAAAMSAHTSPDTSAEYRKTIRMKASAGALFDALTSVASLTAWWTRATGSSDAGDRLEFTFGPPQPCVMRVDEATRPATVRWTVTECGFLPDWVGTRPTFVITPAGRDECELRFRHHGLTPALDCFDMCRKGWDDALEKLHEYVEAKQR